MSRYIHVNMDDGSMIVRNYLAVGGPNDQTGYVYRVPDDFELIIPLEDMGNYIYIYELLDNTVGSELVFQSN